MIGRKILTICQAPLKSVGQKQTTPHYNFLRSQGRGIFVEASPFQQSVSLTNGLTGNRRDAALARPEQGRKSLNECPGSNLEPRSDSLTATSAKFDSARLADTPTMLLVAAATVGINRLTLGA